MLKLSISGCHGRMGRRITELALKDSDFKVTTLLEHKEHPRIEEKIEGLPVTADNSALKGSDVLIEFTLPEATLANLKACAAHNVKMVIGTTGLTPEQTAEVKQASQKIPIVFSSNMSVGVNVTFKMAQIAAAVLGENSHVKITEAHHIHKKDAPSGTAKTLAEIIEQASGRKVQDIHSLREGEIVGDHTVVFECEEDAVTIMHHAKTRDIFAKGALVAAKFLADKKNGLFTMQDVLGLK